MMRATILADSLNEETGDRLTSFLLEGVPKFLVAEINTHRMSRNSASSRAIPVKKVWRQVWSEPFTPVYWGKNGKGMAAKSELTGFRLWLAKRLYYAARLVPVGVAIATSWLGLHKQTANRLIEPWMTTSIVMTSSTWENFYRLRLDKAAQPEFQTLARLMLEQHKDSIPASLTAGQWHIPFRDENTDSLSIEDAVRVCTARLARLSYKNFAGKFDLADDIRLHDSLLSSKHMSPFEHCARAMSRVELIQSPTLQGNLRGFAQYRKMIPGESGENGPFNPAELWHELYE